MGKLDEKLKESLKNYDKPDSLTKVVFRLCRTADDKQKVIDYIDRVHPKRGKLLEYIGVIAIEAGTAEGELEDCDDDYWDNED